MCEPLCFRYLCFRLCGFPNTLTATKVSLCITAFPGKQKEPAGLGGSKSAASMQVVCISHHAAFQKTCDALVKVGVMKQDPLGSWHKYSHQSSHMRTILQVCQWKRSLPLYARLKLQQETSKCITIFQLLQLRLGFLPSALQISVQNGVSQVGVQTSDGNASGTCELKYCNWVCCVWSFANALINCSTKREVGQQSDATLQIVFVLSLSKYPLRLSQPG